jgi:hypothetical protein
MERLAPPFSESSYMNEDGTARANRRQAAMETSPKRRTVCETTNGRKRETQVQAISELTEEQKAKRAGQAAEYYGKPRGSTTEEQKRRKVLLGLLAEQK